VVEGVWAVERDDCMHVIHVLQGVSSSREGQVLAWNILGLDWSLYESIHVRMASLCEV
jgi:hypothetical protein